MLPAAHDLSMLSLFLQADPIVKGVMLLLLFCSVICWAIIIEKLVRLHRLGRAARDFDNEVRAGSAMTNMAAMPKSTRSIVEAAWQAWRDDDGDESRGERRDRIERAMRAAMTAQLRDSETGLPFLATIGSAAPFIGLFGTVWGIMNSFTAIAQSSDTSLAVVAPGIAEALFATAIGLVAAIPAVIAYNALSTRLGRLSQRMGASIAVLGVALSRVRKAPLVKAAE
ncbi:flagellar motor protein MotA [Azospirillum sp. RWY-5-1]|uniref:Flagellar motor protein MotA n=2 Tax=Azospirillum oleiclasticum TaxID=2735135 RepID=A0ABX2T8E3_9PROT|nr:flagellar motor protein MotA [Azospirillum oleiclasticum]NYZ19522.1 flagellar motor protein MotA [Azospirillum oleiclasticum]